MRALAFALVLILAAVGSGRASPQASQAPAQTLTNDDVIRMVRAQLSPGVIIATIEATGKTFDLSPDGLIALKEAGVPDAIIHAMVTRTRPPIDWPLAAVTPQARENSDLLATSKDPAFILQNFRTLYIDASKAEFFGSDQVTAALGEVKGFAALKIAIVDNPSVADVVLQVGYTFAWDYPFSLLHQNTSLVLASGKGTGPFSGPAGAKSVAKEVVRILTPYRVSPSKNKGS